MNNATLTGFYVDTHGNTCSVSESGSVDRILESFRIYVLQSVECGLYMEVRP